jgi:hypothetical protein
MKRFPNCRDKIVTGSGFFFYSVHFKLTDMANLFVDLGDSQTDNDLLT